MSTYEQLIHRLVDNEPNGGYTDPTRLEWAGKLSTFELRIAIEHNRGELDCCSDIDDRFIDPAIFAYTDLEYRLAAAVLVNHLRDVYRSRVLELVWHDVRAAIERNEQLPPDDFDQRCNEERIEMEAQQS